MAISIYPGYEVDPVDSVEPITTEQVKARLRIDVSDTSLDDQIPVLIRAARQYVERYTKCILSTWRVINQYYDAWPTDRIFRLSFFPINPGVVDFEVKYYDEDEVLQILSGVQLDSVSFPHRVYIPLSIPLPVLAEGLGKIFITSSYGSEDGSDSIEPLVQCMYMIIQAWLENGSDFDISDMKFIHSILDQYTAR